ncbi:hypothetical protein RD792_016208 [Penstemon davidsonii]|uniref:Histone H2B n=1 Tax=Penstemon davidsonii TaxID=160366 RepID=A0ABR0CKI6_9LAMI|nr:hypothetical protein RD792_016208 [Penstemon davidsonii]
MTPKKPAAEKASALEKKLKAIKKLKKKVVSVSSRDKEEDRLEDFKFYIVRVLEQVHPGLGISDPAMNMINSFIYGIFEKLVEESARLLRCSEDPLRISSNQIKDAVRLVLPPCELVNRAMRNGAKAVSNDYKNYNLMSSDFMSRFDGLGL